MLNSVMVSRILELSEKKTRYERLKIMISNWKNVVYVAIITLTVKVALEQLALAFIKMRA